MAVIAVVCRHPVYMYICAIYLQIHIQDYIPIPTGVSNPKPALQIYIHANLTFVNHAHHQFMHMYTGRYGMHDWFECSMPNPDLSLKLVVFQG